jgi:hypothetical protein
MAILFSVAYYSMVLLQKMIYILRETPAPVFCYPIRDGAADPEVIWNRVGRLMDSL